MNRPGPADCQVDRPVHHPVATPAPTPVAQVTAVTPTAQAAPIPPVAPEQDWRTAWASALDTLEMDVIAAERLLADDHRSRDLPPADPWSPPAGLGPLPLDLRPRADAILARQLATAAAMVAGIGATRRQAALAGRLESGRDDDRPAYLDCAL
jgi:hypothetical protein